ncbi:MAG: PAS domain S-box protein [Spirochaetes bacterium]|jgi:PAS domain S-box-containing protein|nr:PAS domain S-box protein [Spirochaetota bacterium]
MTQSVEESYRERAIEHYRRHGENDRRENLSSEQLIEELRIHQIELQLQNEDLMRAREEAEQAQEAAEAERDRYYELFHWSPVAYLLTDEAGRITEANDSAAQLLGVERNELLSRTLDRFFGSGEAARVMGAVKQAETEGVAGPLTVSVSRPASGQAAGKTVVELRLRLSNDGNESEADDAPILVAMSDVTDRKLREEEHERSLRYYRRLLGEMSHRVKNNLQVLASIIELERRGHENDPVLQRMAERVRNVSRIHTALHEAAIDVEHVDLIATVRGFVDQFSSSLAPHLTLTFESPPHEKITVEVRRAAQLNLVLNELMTNATQHAFPDERAVGRIWVSLAADEGTVKMTVADNGIGMREAPGDDRQSVGTLLVTQFVEELGGEWRTESSAGVRHEITVPLQ